jgi:hypothetical protein
MTHEVTHTLLNIAGVFLGSSAIVLVGMLKAQDYGEKDDEARRIRIGFEIAPVPLNLNGKDRNLVGLDSYWVNGRT